MNNRKAYPSDVSDEESAFVAPYLTLISDYAPQRLDPLRQVFNAARWIVRTRAQWDMMPNDLPPWTVVYQQTRRRLARSVFAEIVDDLRMLLSLSRGRTEDPSAVVVDSRTLQSTPESRHRAGYDGARRRKGSKVHIVVDTLGHLAAVHVTAASEQDRAQIGELAERCSKPSENR